VPELMPDEGAKAGFIKLEQLYDFLIELGPPMSPTIKSEKITQQAYNLVYAEMEEMCMNYAGHLNFWHVLEVLIVNRLGFDALPVSKESPDRTNYMSRIYRVLHRQIGAEKIQSAFMGRKVRHNLNQTVNRLIGREPTDAEVNLVMRIRGIEKAKAETAYRSPRPSTVVNNDTSTAVKSVWRSSIESCMKRSNIVHVIDGKEHLLSNQGPILCLSHPIVLMKAYTLTTEVAEFDVKRLEMCLERVLEATKHSETLKFELAALTVRLLQSQGLNEPHILDIRHILTKVCQQIVQFRG